MSPTSAYPELPDPTAGMTGEQILGAEIPYDNELTPLANDDKNSFLDATNASFDDQESRLREARDAVKDAFEASKPRPVTRESETAKIDLRTVDEKLKYVGATGSYIGNVRDYELAA